MPTSCLRALALSLAFCGVLMAGPGDAWATRIDRLVDRDSGLIGGGAFGPAGGSNPGILLASPSFGSSSSSSSGGAVAHGSGSESGGDGPPPATRVGEIPVPEPSGAMVFTLGLFALAVVFRDKFEA